MNFLSFGQVLRGTACSVLLLSWLCLPGCASNSNLVSSALDRVGQDETNVNNKLLLNRRFQSTLPPELNADFRAVFQIKGFIQRSWAINGDKARLWCVDSTREMQKKRGEVDPETGEGKVTVAAVGQRCAPAVESAVDIEHTCVTVEEAKKHFAKCRVETRVELTRYAVDLDEELNFRFKKDEAFNPDGARVISVVAEDIQHISGDFTADAANRKALENAIGTAAMKLHEEMAALETFSTNP